MPRHSSSREPARHRCASGFTLIEVMITVAIVAILAAVAYPSYRDQVRRAARAEAKGAMLENVQFLERNYTVNSCYHRNDAACASAANVTLPHTQSPTAGTAKYNITVTFSADAPCTLGQCFTLSAAPTGSMTGDPCGTLTLTQASVRGSGDYDGDGTAGDADDTVACWGR